MCDVEYLKKLLKLLEFLIDKHKGDDKDLKVIREGIAFSDPGKMPDEVLQKFISAKEKLLDAYFKKVISENGVEGKVHKRNKSFIAFLEKET